jgi:hypothetical protein
MSKRAKTKLVEPWRSINGAVWLIGLAILFWKGWWWPGILILVAISVILEAVLRVAVPGSTIPALEPEAEETQEEAEEMVKPEEVEQVVSPPVQAVETPELHRFDLLPPKCPGCGAPIHRDEDGVQWTGPRSAECRYCGTILPLQQA